MTHIPDDHFGLSKRFAGEFGVEGISPLRAQRTRIGDVGDDGISDPRPTWDHHTEDASYMCVRPPKHEFSRWVRVDHPSALKSAIASMSWRPDKMHRALTTHSLRVNAISDRRVNIAR